MLGNELRFGAVYAADGVGNEDEEMPLLLRSRAPLFEAFWQGRLIPGARIESLPFIEVGLPSQNFPCRSRQNEPSTEEAVL
jgi:hypothetical protein